MMNCCLIAVGVAATHLLGVELNVEPQEAIMTRVILTGVLAMLLVSPALAHTAESRHNTHAGAYHSFAQGAVQSRIGHARVWQRPPGSGYDAPRATIRPEVTWDPYGLRWD